MNTEDKNLEALDSDSSEDLNDSLEGSQLSWFALRVLRNEERCVAQIKEHIALRKLQDKIVDVKYFKEFDITESEEFDPHSEFLPKKGFKSTSNSIWVRLPNGNYKRIRAVEKKPLSGMIFIKMIFDLDLFKMIRSWDAGYSFLGAPSPLPMSESQLQKTASSLNDEAPDLLAYAQKKNYQVVEGARTNVVVHETKEIPEEVVEEKEEKKAVVDEPIEVAEEKRALTPEEEKEAQKARIYSELNIKDNTAKSFVVDKPAEKQKSTSSKKKPTFGVNDFVFIKHLGFKGVIQEISYEDNKVVVGVQMFGRRQPVECKISDIQLI